MKSDETRLAEWTADEIFFDVGDAPGVRRVYTRDAWVKLMHEVRGYFEALLSSKKSRDPGDILPKDINSFLRMLSSFADISRNSGQPGEEVHQFILAFIEPRAMLRFSGVQEAELHLLDIWRNAITKAVEHARVAGHLTLPATAGPPPPLLPPSPPGTAGIPGDDEEEPSAGRTPDPPYDRT